MKKLNSILIISVLTVLILFTGCGKKNGSDEEAEKEEKTLIPIEVATVSKGAIAAYFNGTATLAAEEDAQVVAKVSGVVQEILIEEGDRIQAGAILARLDGEILTVELAQSEARFQRLKEDFKRKETLFQKDAISVEIYQQAKFELESQQAARDLVNLNLGYTEIRSPIGGIITERHIKVGNMVLTNATAFRVTDFEPLLAVLYVPEREIGKLAVGQKALLTVDALTETTFDGRIDRISPIVDPRTGTVKVTIVVNDELGLLKVGMFSRVSIIYDIHENILMVPREAILLEDDESLVFVVRDSMVFREKVVTGYVNTSHLEILSGLTISDTVVVMGQGSLKDSALIDIIDN